MMKLQWFYIRSEDLSELVNSCPTQKLALNLTLQSEQQSLIEEQPRTKTQKKKIKSKIQKPQIKKLKNKKGKILIETSSRSKKVRVFDDFMKVYLFQ